MLLDGGCRLLTRLEVLMSIVLPRVVPSSVSWRKSSLVTAACREVQRHRAERVCRQTQAVLPSVKLVLRAPVSGERWAAAGVSEAACGGGSSPGCRRGVRTRGLRATNQALEVF